MPKQVKYVTKVVGVSGVTLEGLLHYEDSGWHVGSDALEEWLEKLQDKRVTLVIDSHERDESHLLPSEVQE